MSGLHKWTYRLNLYLISVFPMFLIPFLIFHCIIGQSKKRGSEQLAHILTLEKTVEGYQHHVDKLEMDLVKDCVSDVIDHNLQLNVARGSLSKATHALEQKKNALGVSAQTDLYLLRNNKWLQSQTNAQALKIQIRERLHQQNLELERLEHPYRGSSNGK